MGISTDYINVTFDYHQLWHHSSKARLCEKDHKSDRKGFYIVMKNILIEILFFSALELIDSILKKDCEQNWCNLYTHNCTLYNLFLFFIGKKDIINKLKITNTNVLLILNVI